MSLELALLIGFLFHLIGDYVTQNDWLAQNKTKEFHIAFLHAAIYSAPFAWLISGNVYSGYQLFAILITHALIDHFRLAVYWIKLVNWNWSSNNYGFSDKTPAWLSTWLLIIVDNIFHIVINSACIYWSFQAVSTAAIPRLSPDPFEKVIGQVDSVDSTIYADNCYFLQFKKRNPFEENRWVVAKVKAVKQGYVLHDYVKGRWTNLTNQVEPISYFKEKKAVLCDCPK